MSRRSITIWAAGAAVAACAIAGCSGGGSSKPASTSGAAAPSAATTVLVDGQKQNTTGAVTCTAADADTNVAIGDAAAGVGAVIGNDSPTSVHSVGLGSVNGVTLGYSDAATSPAAPTVTKNDKSYKITGNAVGFDATSQQQITKPFELDFTCP
jgi:ipoprotein LpqH